MVYIGLRPEAFTRFSQAMGLGPDLMIGVMGREGINIARQIRGGLESGQDLKGSLLWKKRPERFFPAPI